MSENVCDRCDHPASYHPFHAGERWGCHKDGCGCDQYHTAAESPPEDLDAGRVLIEAALALEASSQDGDRWTDHIARCHWCRWQNSRHADGCEVATFRAAVARYEAGWGDTRKGAGDGHLPASTDCVVELVRLRSALARIREAAATRYFASSIDTPEGLAASVDTALEVGRDDARTCARYREDISEIATICGMAQWGFPPEVVRMVRRLKDERDEAQGESILNRNALKRAQAENAQMAAALARFAAVEFPYGSPPGTWVAETKFCNRQITVADIEAARTALCGRKATESGGAK